MHASRLFIRFSLALATLGAAHGLLAQTALTPAVTGQFQPVESAAPAPAPVAVPEPVVAPAPVVTEAKKPSEPPPAPPLPQGCRPLTDKAAAVDLQAVTAQAKKRELTEQLQLVEEAIDLWSRAVDQCDGRAKERAQRNLADNLKVMEKLSEQQGAGPQCEAAHRDASALQDLARQALTERRFSEASVLFRKSEDAWDDASERCTGTQQEVAIKRRDQSEVDGFNAAYCAPVFEKARDLTQKLRTSGTTLPREEKQEMSMLAETHWRAALTQCKGAVVDIARSNAQSQARERGTPFVARYAIPPPPAGASAERKVPNKSLPTPTAATATAAATAAIAPTATLTTTAPTKIEGAAPVPPPAPAPSVIAGLAASVGSMFSSVVGTASASATAVPLAGVAAGAAAGTAAGAVAATALAETGKPTVPTPQPPDFMSGSTRFVGKFVRDVDSLTYSGTGKITWANGDSFDGTLQKSLRHGKGMFQWANGQSYDGDWNLDKPVGEAKMRFANGNQYQGSIANGVPQGQGNMRYASGDTYVGQFNAGVPHGRGVYTWKNGQQYDGEWVNDKAQGRGKLKFANGNVYEGPVVNGVPNGRGKTVFASGEIYEGDVVNGVPHGEGSFTWPNGDEYEGQWQAGKKHGEGAMTWKSGDRWEGTFDNDRQVEHPATPAPPPRATLATVPAPAAAVKK